MAIYAPYLLKQCELVRSSYGLLKECIETREVLSNIGTDVDAKSLEEIQTIIDEFMSLHCKIKKFCEK